MLVQHRRRPVVRLDDEPVPAAAKVARARAQGLARQAAAAPETAAAAPAAPPVKRARAAKKSTRAAKPAAGKAPS